MRVLLVTLSTLLALARTRPWEPLIILFSVMVAGAGLTAVSLINSSADQSHTAEQLSWLQPTLTVRATDPSQPLLQQDYAALRRAGFDELIAVTRMTQALGCTPSPLQDTEIIAVDSVAAFRHTRVNGRRMAVTEPPAASGIATAPATLSALGCEAQSLVLFNDATLPQVTALPSLPYGIILMDLALFYRNQSLADMPLSELVALAPINTARRAALIRSLPMHLRVNTPPQVRGNTQMSESFRLNLWAMGALMAMVSLFIVINALNLMYRARLPSLVRLRQSGVGTAELAMALAAELALYTAVGSALGVVSGAWITLTFTPAIAETFSSLFAINYIESRPAIISLSIRAWLISLFALLFFMLIPIIRLSRLLTFERARAHRALPLWPGLIALALALLAPLFAVDSVSALAVVGISLVSGSICIICWLPPLLQRLARHIPRRLPLLHFSVSSAVQLSQRTRLAVCAFFIALTTNIAMNVMTDSFRQATYDWISHRLSADAYVYTPSLPEALNAPASLTLTPVYRSDITVNGRPARGRSYPSTLRARRGLVTDKIVANAWQQFERGEGVFINQQLAFRLSVSLGDSLTLDVGDEVSTSNKVIGIYPDYGNPDSQLLLPIARLASAGNYSGVISVMMRAGGSAETLAQWRETLPDETDFYAAPELLRLSMAAFDRTFLITQALNIATLSVAALAFLLAIVMVSLDIRPQLSLLRSLGLSAFAIHLALFTQYLILCLGTALLALPAGIGLSWIFIHKVNRYAFDWIYPLKVDLAVLFSSTAISVAAILLVLLIPLARLRPRVDLRQEVTL